LRSWASSGFATGRPLASRRLADPFTDLESGLTHSGAKCASVVEWKYLPDEVHWLGVLGSDSGAHHNYGLALLQGDKGIAYVARTHHDPLDFQATEAGRWISADLSPFWR